MTAQWGKVRLGTKGKELMNMDNGMVTAAGRGDKKLNGNGKKTIKIQKKPTLSGITHMSFI